MYSCNSVFAVVITYVNHWMCLLEVSTYKDAFVALTSHAHLEAELVHYQDQNWKVKLIAIPKICVDDIATTVAGLCPFCSLPNMVQNIRIALFY